MIFERTCFTWENTSIYSQESVPKDILHPQWQTATQYLSSLTIGINERGSGVINMHFSLPKELKRVHWRIQAAAERMAASLKATTVVRTSSVYGGLDYELRFESIPLNEIMVEFMMKKYITLLAPKMKPFANCYPSIRRECFIKEKGGREVPRGQYLYEKLVNEK